MKQSTWLLPFACALAAALPVGAAEANDERFESAEVSWRLAESDGSARLLLHERDFTVAHSGRGSEHFRVWSTQATYVYLVHPVAPARIIDELVPSLWVKADRPGLRLMLRVVLPRSKDRDGKTVTVLLDGDFYTQPGGWQQLRVGELKKQFDAVVRIRRLAGPVDDREAYIDHVVLNAYSAPGTTELWTDDLRLDGYGWAQPSATPIGLMGASAAPTPNSVEHQTRSAELRGSVLLVEQHPYFARVIEHNGEPFTWLKELGFNTILLRSPPSAAQLSEAHEADVWLVAPPSMIQGVLDLAPGHRRIVAWRLGVVAGAAELPAIKNLAAQLQRQDRAARRPILCDLQAGAGQFAGSGDILMFGRPVIGTSFDLRDYGPWLQQQSRPLNGKPFWGTIQTEPSARLVEQLAITKTGLPGLHSTEIRLPKLAADPAQIRLLAFETIAAGARGICFLSRSRLDQQDDVAKLRAASLRLINSELSLVEPWAAGGAVAGEIDMHESDTWGRMLETDRSRLLVITRHAPRQQYVPRPRRLEPMTFAAHSVPITDQAYQLGANGLQPLLRSQAGGPRITIRDPASVTLILFTQDPLAINRCTRELSENRARSARLYQEIASLQLRQTFDIVTQLGRAEPVKPTLDEARAMLDRAEQLLRGRDLHHAATTARAAQQLIRSVQLATWEEAVLSFPTPASSLLCSSFATLPLHADAANRLATATWGANVLPAGDCESLDAMLRSGWRQHDCDGMTQRTLVELSLDDPAGGRSALRMVSRRSPADAGGPNIRPLSITSAPVIVDAGQSLRIHGWVKVPAAITGSGQELMIYDSSSGEELGERVSPTNGWREFTLYRIATQRGELTLTFALTGNGEAWIDEVSVAVLK